MPSVPGAPVVASPDAVLTSKKLPPSGVSPGGFWNVASSIVYAWVITIPASAIVAGLTYWAALLLR